MFWMGWAVALVAGLLSIEAARRAIRRRHPRLTTFRLDLLLVALLFLGFCVSAWEHIKSEREVERLRADLDQRTARWRLSTEQREGILAALTQTPPAQVLILCRLMDVESCDLAGDIAAVLKGLGWTVLGPGENSLNSFFGLDVFSQNAVGPLAGADRVLSALKEAGLLVHSEPVPANSIGGPIPDGTICIIVGRRPI